MSEIKSDVLVKKESSEIEKIEEKNVPIKEKSTNLNQKGSDGLIVLKSEHLETEVKPIDNLEELFEEGDYARLDGVQKVSLYRQEKVDEKYLNSGNIEDLFKKISNGEDIDLEDINKALIDLIDYLTLRIFKEALQELKVEGHVVTKIEKVKDVYIRGSKNIEGTEKEIGYENTGGNIIGKRKINTMQTDKEISFELKSRKVDIYNADSLEKHPNIKNLEEIKGDSTHKTSNIVVAEKNSMIFKEKTGRTIFTFDFGGLFGRNVEGAAIKESSLTRSYIVYDSDVLGDVIKEGDFEKLNDSAYQLVNQYYFETDAKRIDTSEMFESGIITWVPFVGGIAHLLSKADLAPEKITAGDCLWAAVDAASIVTLGVGYLSSTAAKGAAVPKIAQNSAKEIAGKTAGTATKKGIKSVGKIASREVSKESLDTLGGNYIKDLTKKSGRKIDPQKINFKGWKKISPKENMHAKANFSKTKGDLIKQWEVKRGKSWPRYETDVIDPITGTKIRTKGSLYDAHHIQPTNLGGKNLADNLIPAHANKHYDHRGIHNPAGPLAELTNKLKEV